jgi:ubiquinone/menaquinone biosynthesis C-methylase UbiE
MKRSPSHYRAIPDYYDAEYDGSEMLQRDVPLFLSHLPKRPQSILELATGTARAAIPIAQAGHRVVGVDYDSHMLRRAREKRDSVGLTDRQLHLVHANALKLRLGQTFDSVCIFFNTFLNFTTLAEQDRLLQVVRSHLKPRGRFWLDIFNPSLELLSREHSEHLDPATFHVPALDRTVHRDTEIRPDPATQIQRITFHYLWFDTDGSEQRQQISFDLTWLSPRELTLLLERNGFQIERLYGDYDRSPVTRDSPRLIALCRRI